MKGAEGHATTRGSRVERERVVLAGMTLGDHASRNRQRELSQSRNLYMPVNPKANQNKVAILSEAKNLLLCGQLYSVHCLAEDSSSQRTLLRMTTVLYMSLRPRRQTPRYSCALAFGYQPIQEAHHER
jgi:hypothetical protein